MSGRKYYCFCDSNCKFETMTKEQIMAAIAQAAESGLVFDENAAFITKVKESNAGNMLSFWVGTQAQYNALQSIDTSCYYIIKDKKEMTSTSVTVTLEADKWYNKEQSVSVNGAGANCLVIATPTSTADNESAYAGSRVRCTGQQAGNLIFKCDEVPTNAITVDVAIFNGNTTAAILNAGGGSGGMSMKLLWKNASPTSEFPPQTLNLDFSKSKKVGILYCRDSESNSYLEYREMLIEQNRGYHHTMKHGTSSNLIMRFIKSLTRTSIVFDNAYSNTSIYNHLMIPFEIYSIE